MGGRAAPLGRPYLQCVIERGGQDVLRMGKGVCVCVCMLRLSQRA